MRQWMKRPAFLISLAVLTVAAILGFITLRNRQTLTVNPAQAKTAAANAAVSQTLSTTESTAGEEITAENTTEDMTTTAEVPTTEEPTTAAPAKPSTKVEIVAYFNESVNRVKTDRPGYIWSDCVNIDKDNIECDNKLLNAAVPTVLGAVKSIAKFGEWQTQPSVAKGADHSNFPVAGKSWASKLDASFVKSATCTENGSCYTIKIVLMNEDVSTLPKDASTLRTGKVMNAWDSSLMEDAKAAEPFVTITKFQTNYRNASITCTIDKATSRLKTITYSLNSIFVVDVKQFGSAHATVPFGKEEKYIMSS